ncbi:TetR/AcrR family transcriptional regulator [Robertmurraya korlensis]|uniref:TetR/AcrR family transcriptional regulator n=1 Tax=Robertmurraya korlensis TaxID=519977 RepID=UPI00203EFE2C|nr:TetR/AcrR family transcriptional regulator [Robertmurraya korlensis]MCM3600773.1 TetR/AcrR family transcriptional regulator [Robertmurraya korlensis]
MENFSIREKKKAQLKMAILDEMLRLLRTKELSEISVEELCQNIQTTKVTFFKYFRYKEQVLDYFVIRWLYERSNEIHSKHFNGKEGILHIFQTISEDTLGKKIMVSLVHYYSKLNEKPTIMEITPYEYYLFNEEAFQNKVKPMELNQIFIYYLSQMESVNEADYYHISCQFLALMYGVPIQTHIMEIEDMYLFYKIGVNSILG